MLLLIMTFLCNEKNSRPSRWKNALLKLRLSVKQLMSINQSISSVKIKIYWTSLLKLYLGDKTQRVIMNEISAGW